MSIINTKKEANKEHSKISEIDKFNNIVKITLVLALAGIPLVFLPLGGEFDHFYFPKVAAMFIIVLSFIIMLILNFRKVGNFIDRDWINKTLFIYLALLILSVFFTDNVELAIFGSPGRLEGLITIIMYMTLFLIARSCHKLNDKFFAIVLGTAIIVSSYGILQTFGIDPFPRDFLRVNWGSRAFSTMGNPNFLGSYLVLMLPISMYLYIIKNRKTGLAGYVILLYCLLCTSTRGSWLGAIASIISFVVLHYFFYRFNKEEFRRYIILFIISLIILCIFNFQTDGALLDRFLSISKDGKEFLTSGENSDFTGAHRGFIWKRVIELIKNRPLVGYGIENLEEAFKTHYSHDMIEFWGEVRNVDKAHNEYLHIAVTSGIPSLTAYLSFLILILKKGLTHLRNNSMLLLLFSSVLGYLVAAFFNISVVSVAYVYWIFLGLLVAKNTKNEYEILNFNKIDEETK